MIINTIIFFIGLFQTGTPTPTVTPTPTGAPYCEINQTTTPTTPFNGEFSYIELFTPTPGPTNTPDGTLTPFPTLPATPTLFPTNYYWANNKSIDITRYQHPTQSITYEDNFGNPCNGGYIVGVKYLYDQRSNGQNQGYKNNRTYNDGTTTYEDRPATGDYGVSYNQYRAWLISNNVLPGVPTQIGSYNLSSASRPNTDLQLNNLYWKVYFPARALNISSNPLGYQRIHDVVVFCRGGNYDATPTPEPLPQPTPTYCRMPIEQSENSVSNFSANFVGQSCYVLLPTFYIDFDDLPEWMQTLFGGAGGAELPIVDIQGITICIDRYSFTLELLDIDFVPIITALISMLSAFLLIQEFRS